MSKTENLSAARKVCRILANLSDPKVSRLTDIAERTGLDASTCLRLLRDLEVEGFVERDPQSKAFELGSQIYAMHHAMLGGLDVRALARPSLIRLARRFSDTAILSVPLGWESVCLDLCLGDYPITANYLAVGSRRPLGIGAGSLALMISMEDSVIQAVLPRVRGALERHYPAYAPQHLDEVLARGKKQGYSLLVDVVVEKMSGVGVPFHSPGGQPIGALSVAALTERIVGREEELAEALKAEAALIEQAWMPEGYIAATPKVPA